MPRLDHDEQIRKLAQVADIRVTDCLDVCDQANVLVVQPTPEGRAAGGRPIWLALVNDEQATADIADGVRAGGPGLAPMPAILESHRFTPPHRLPSGLGASSTDHLE
ncbi:(2Fe-2S) ferredoxin domain-containing protein [Nonomuraea sp. NPDC050663]|uniref:(2Fe-2S) ferredoxin domain-containing protein n=1 Tax=Nonomuraea sp. NPDC050663 TaxID=3364370 RepID=UPI003795BE99